MSEPNRGRVLVLGSQGMGRGDDGLGLTILQNFLKALVTNPLRPDKIVCWNGGVTLLAADSPTVGVLQDLEGVGVEILACKTCVEHFGLQGSLRAGEVATMPIIRTMAKVVGSGTADAPPSELPLPAVAPKLARQASYPPEPP